VATLATLQNEKENTGLGMGLPLLVKIDEVVLIPRQLKYSQWSYNHDFFIYCTLYDIKTL
jgi:hypothetical protein